MINYNDGKWHGWTGGECPVHPKSVIVIKWSCNGVETQEMRAANFPSTHWLMTTICAFRVVKEHREPREWWINPSHIRPRISDHEPSRPHAYIRVREVLE